MIPCGIIKCMKIDGRQIAATIFEDLQKKVATLGEKGITPKLAVILVGEDPASEAYVLQKKLKGENINAVVEIFTYPVTVTADELLEKIRLLNHDRNTHGIIVQRPLPEQINPEVIGQEIANEKDVDGFKSESPFQVPVVMAVVRILEEVYKSLRPDSGVVAEAPPQNDVILANEVRPESISDFHFWLKSQHIILLGKGSTAGKPLLDYFNEIGAQPTLIHSQTKNPQELTKQADIIISSVGKTGLIRPEQLKNGTILISVGLSRGEDSKLHGDYNEEEIQTIASFYTPTPGGVGPVNVAMLLFNLITAAEQQP